MQVNSIPPKKSSPSLLSKFARAGLAVALVPACLIGLILHYTVPDDPAVRKRIGHVWHFLAICGFLVCVFYWFNVRRGYGVAAMLMFCNLQIADDYALLFPKINERVGLGMLFLIGWTVAIVQLFLNYPVETWQNVAAIIAFGVMILLYGAASISFFKRSFRKSSS